MSKSLADWDVSPNEFCEKMGYKVFEAPVCYNGEPLAKTLTLQPNQLYSRQNRGIVNFSFVEMITGLVDILWLTPKMLSILLMIGAVLVTFLYGVYLLNLW